MTAAGRQLTDVSSKRRSMLPTRRLSLEWPLWQLMIIGNLFEALCKLNLLAKLIALLLGYTLGSPPHWQCKTSQVIWESANEPIAAHGALNLSVLRAVKFV